MRISTDEPALTNLFEKGQVGLIRLEFQRLNDVIASLRAEVEHRRLNDANIDELREYFIKFCDVLIEEKNENYRMFVIERAKAIGLVEANKRLKEVIRRECDGGVDLREEAQRTVEENHHLRSDKERLRVAGDKVCELGERLVQTACNQMPLGINNPEVFAFTRAVKEWEATK